MDPVSAIVNLASTIMNKLWGNKDDQLKQQFILELQQKVGELDLAKKQADINIEEAKSSSLFVAGWRPFVGWICGLAFSWQFVIQPILMFIGSALGHPITPPVFDTSSMITILLGMLGLGSFRTYEKIKKV